MENRPRYLAEMIGSLVLVFAVGAAAVTSAFDPLLVALAAGAAFAGAWWVFGHRAGAHLNPALTIASVAARRTPTKELLPILLAQVVGAVLAGALLFLVLDGQPGSTGAEVLAASAPTTAGWAVASVVALEAVLTAAFCLAWLHLTERPGGEPLTGLALGGAYAGAMVGSLAVTWSALNPLRTVGPALLAQATAGAWVFWLAPVAGALLAAGTWLAVVEPQRAAAAQPRVANA